MQKTSEKRFVCDVCGAGSDRWVEYCERCGSERPWTDTGADRDDDGPVLLLDVSALAVRRLALFPVLDNLLGGGWPCGASMLLSGFPGVGKSSLALRVAEALEVHGLCSLYLSNEMPVELLRLMQERVAPGLRRMRAWRKPSTAQAVDWIVENRPGLVVLDSVQRAGDGFLPLLDVCGGLGISFLAIGHATKEGDFAGLIGDQHDVDVTVWLEVGESGGLLVKVEKNRFGPAPVAGEVIR